MGRPDRRCQPAPAAAPRLPRSASCRCSSLITRCAGGCASGSPGSSARSPSCAPSPRRAAAHPDCRCQPIPPAPSAAAASSTHEHAASTSRSTRPISSAPRRSRSASATMSAGSSSASNSSWRTAAHGVREMADIGLPIFLDLKFHDIPNTVAKAVQALRPLEPAILTVHAAGGRAMLEDAKAAAPTGTKVVAVTMLTSLDASDLRLDRPRRRPARTGRAPRRTRANRPGVDGIVCSGEEVAAAQECLAATASSSSPACAPPTAQIAATRSASSPRAPRSTPAHRSSSSAARSPRPKIPTGRARDRGDALILTPPSPNSGDARSRRALGWLSAVAAAALTALMLHAGDPGSADWWPIAVH